MFIRADLWTLIGFCLQFVLPLLVGLVTTKVTSSTAKTLLLAALSLVVSVASSALAAHDAGQSFDLVSALLTAIAGFIVSVGAHFGVWKPTGAAAAVQGRLRRRPVAPTPPAPPAAG